MQAAPPVAAPMVVSTIQPQRKEHYMSKCVLGLSITHIIIGALCVLFLGIRAGVHVAHKFDGEAIFAGIFFILTGSFGIVSSRRKTRCYIVTFLILAIISALSASGIFLVSLTKVISNYYDYVGTGLNTVLLILGVAQMVLMIIASALGCHGLCGGNQIQPVVMTGQVQYVAGPDGQQQMVILPFNQQGAAGPSFNPVHTQLAPPPPRYESEMKLPIPD